MKKVLVFILKVLLTPFMCGNCGSTRNLHNVGLRWIDSSGKYKSKVMVLCPECENLPARELIK